MEKNLKQYARDLRNNATDAERLLWRRLKSRQLAGVKFRGQQVIEGFIVDFVTFEKRIVIELDGGQHAGQTEKDRARDAFLSRNGFAVLRFWNNEIFENMEGVLEVVREHCMSRKNGGHPPPAPFIPIEMDGGSRRGRGRKP